MSVTMDKETRIATSLKMLPSQRDFLDFAATLKGKNRTEFILESALQSAENAVLDQRVFHLNEDQFDAFNTALNEPIDASCIADLFSKKAPWIMEDIRDIQDKLD